MAIQTINVGTSPNDGTGDTVRDAFIKVNGNFTPIDFLVLDGLADPGADKILFWDDSATASAWLTLGSLLSVTGTTLNVAGDATKLDLAGGTLTGILILDADPASALGAATKQYVDAVASGLDPKASCRAATTSAQILATDFENGDTIDGVVLATGDRVLIKDQTTGSENGIYMVNASGAPTRATDADADADVTSGLHTVITEGSSNSKTGFVLTTNDPITVGTTALTFELYASISGTPTATESVLGGLEVGTQAEVDAGTLDDKIVTPNKLNAWGGNASITSEIDEAKKRTRGRNVQSVAYTLVAGDAGKTVVQAGATARNYTIDAATFAGDDQGIIRQEGTGQITIIAGGSTNLRFHSEFVAKTKGQWSWIAWERISATEIALTGQMELAP